LQLHPPERVEAFLASGAWRDECFEDLLTRWAAERGDELAIVDPPNLRDLAGSAPRRLTWSELEREVASQSAGLDGPAVVLQLPNSIELVTRLLACARSGRIAVPLPVQFREHELSQVRRVVASVGPDRGGPEVNRCCTVCFTSGTEAAPKAVPRCAGDWGAIARVTVEGVGIDRDSVLLCPFPIVNMAGIGGMLVPWLLTGSRLILHHPFDLEVFLGQIAEEQVSYTVAPPALLELLLANPAALANADLSSVESIGSGSAPLRPGMVAQWQTQYGIEVLNAFGSNEGIALLSDARSVPDPELRARYFPHPQGPLPVSEAGRRVQVRLTAAGELQVRGPTVIAGYLGPDGALQAALDSDGWLATGDVFEPAGQREEYLRFVDRTKDIIIRGGMNIAPAEVEAMLAGHPGVAEVAVIGVPHAVLGETSCAVAVPAAGAQPTLEELVEYLRAQQIASYKLPQRLVLVSELPRNPVGKVLKRALREQLAQAEAPAAGS